MFSQALRNARMPVLPTLFRSCHDKWTRKMKSVTLKCNTLFKNPVSSMCLAGTTVVASWSLALEVAGSNPFTEIPCILSLNSVEIFRENTWLRPVNLFLLYFKPGGVILKPNIKIYCWFCSLEHSFGHIYAMVAAYNNGNFDENICYLSGFMLLEFSCGQGLIITVTALSGKFTHVYRKVSEFLRMLNQKYFLHQFLIVFRLLSIFYKV